MFEGDVRICPILAAFSGNKDSTSTGASWASRCKGIECAWWSDEQATCALAVIAKELAHVDSMVSVAKMM